MMPVGDCWKTVRLAAGSLVAEIVPSLGGGVARFDVLRGGQRIEVFRAWPEGGTDDPNALGLYVLVPWSNRISGRGFNFGGAFHELLPNVAGEPCPIHGDGWLSTWRVSAKDDRCIRLEREGGGRSFGFSGLHFHENWQIPEYRRLVAQGVLWTLDLPIPKDGIGVK